MESSEDARAILMKQQFAALHALNRKRASDHETARTIKNAASKVSYQQNVNLHSKAVAASTLSSKIVLVDVAGGCGGSLIAMAAAVQRLVDDGTRITLEVAHASDIKKDKAVMYSAAAAALNIPVDVCVADVRDETFFTELLLQSWGADVLSSCFICKSVSKAGAKKGLKAIVDYITGLFRIIRICRPKQLFLECVEEIESDPDFLRLIIEPLEAMGYKLIHGKRDGSDYADVRRSRWYCIGTLDIDEFNHINTLPPPPDRRRSDLKLKTILLPPHRVTVGVRDSTLKVLRGRAVIDPLSRDAAPRWAYLGKGLLTKAQKAIQVAFGDADRFRYSSGIVNYQFFNVNEVIGFLAPTLTATASSDWYYRDAYGIRLVVALEIALLHGYPLPAIQALLLASRSLALAKQLRTKKVLKGCLDARADAIVRRAVGDGFILPVVEDIFYRMLRARHRTQIREMVIEELSERPSKRARRM